MFVRAMGLCDGSDRNASRIYVTSKQAVRVY